MEYLEELQIVVLRVCLAGDCETQLVEHKVVLECLEMQIVGLYDAMIVISK